VKTGGLGARRQRAGRLTGVRVVDNLIKVKAQTEPTAAAIEHRVQEAIARTADLHARSIRVRMNNSTAHLYGHVPSFAALQIALHAAESVPGVTAVDSEFVVASLAD
jgi:osmotically-inducible protein OsmY